MNKCVTIIVIVLGMAGLARAQSLLGQEDGSPYDAPKMVPFKKRDHIRIQVRERTRASATADLRTDRRSRWDVALDQWIQFSSKNKGLPDLKANGFNPSPEVDLEARFRHDNLGRTTRSSDSAAQRRAFREIGKFDGCVG